MSRISQIGRLLIDERHAAFITSDISRKYLCGFSSSAGFILITKEQSYLLIDFRYYDKAKERVKDCQVILLENVRKQLMDLLVKHGITVVSVESDFMTLSRMEKYKQDYSFVTFDTSSALSDKLTKMRAIKSEEEIEKIVTAQRIAEKAFDKLLNNIRIGQTEKHVAAMLNYYMAEYGSDGLSFDTIAASGVNSASPHAVPTDKKLQEGDFLTLDFGAVYDGYHSDMTRTVAIGHATDKMREMYDAVLSANLDAQKAAKAGISGKLLDSVARSTLDAWNYGEYFGHSLGHGVGLEIHEAPTAGPKSSDSLKEGMIVTIEPGAYITGKYGVRIEDMVAITADGCRCLTRTGKGLIII